LGRLERAYYRVPVVTTARLAEMVRMMEVFARYLANAWKRLEIMNPSRCENGRFHSTGVNWLKSCSQDRWLAVRVEISMHFRHWPGMYPAGIGQARAAS